MFPPIEETGSEGMIRQFSSPDCLTSITQPPSNGSVSISVSPYDMCVEYAELGPGGQCRAQQHQLSSILDKEDYNCKLNRHADGLQDDDSLYDDSPCIKRQEGSTDIW